MQEAFKHVPIVHDTNLLPEIIQIGVSSLVAHELAKELREAEIYALRERGARNRTQLLRILSLRRHGKREAQRNVFSFYDANLLQQ